MKKILTFFISCFLIIHISFSQEYEEILREIFLDAEFFLLDESYVDALAEYQKIYTRGYENNANINYRIGMCYLNIPGEKEKSIPYLQKAVQNTTQNYQEGMFKETKAPYDAWLYMGNAYRINNELEKACQSYQQYQKLLDNPKSEMSKYADQQINSCNNARVAMENPVFYIRENLGEIINTEYDEYRPIIIRTSEDWVYINDLMIFSSNRPGGKGGYDLYCAKINELINK